jgi:hypothetical protein
VGWLSHTDKVDLLGSTVAHFLKRNKLFQVRRDKDEESISKEIEPVEESVQNKTRSEEQGEVVKESFPCEECGKTYSTKGSLRTHKYVHTRNQQVKTEQDLLQVEEVECLSESEEGGSDTSTTSGPVGVEEGGEGVEGGQDRSAREEELEEEEARFIQQGELEERIDSLTELREGLWTCKKCGKDDKSRKVGKHLSINHISFPGSI